MSHRRSTFPVLQKLTKKIIKGNFNEDIDFTLVYMLEIAQKRALKTV